MIESKELRQGNKLSLSASGEIITVSVIEKIFLRVRGKPFAYQFRLLNPIPLTTELLEKAGFVFGHSSDIYDNYSLPNGFYISYCKKSIKEGYRHEKGNYYHGEIHIPIVNVHQLQNLFYCLTGKELQIEL